MVEASTNQEIGYTIQASGEQRTLKVPGYKHGFMLTALPGVVRSGSNSFAILEDKEIWTSQETVGLREWLKEQLFEVDGLVYDVETTIKTVADKEAAHIDEIVDSEGIYTGSRDNAESKFTNADIYVRSRLITFGPFPYPHIVVILVSRYLLMATRESLTKNMNKVQSIQQQVTLSPASVPTIRERMEMIRSCSILGRIDGFPLRVTPERMIARPPIDIGLDSAEEEQARANNLPRHRETYIGIPRRRT